MTLIQNNAEGGTAGTTVTTGNSGGSSGAAFSQISVSGSPTYAYTDTVVAHGSLSYHVSGASGSTAKLYFGGTSGASAAFRAYIYLPTLPGTAQTLFNFQTSTFSGIANINISNANKLYVTDASATVYTAPDALLAATWYRVEAQLEVGADAASGTLRFQYFQADSSTPVASFDSTTANIGSSNIYRSQIGKQTSSATLDIFYDDIAYNDGTLTPIGPYAGTPPTVDAGLDLVNVEPYSSVTLVGVDNSAYSAITSRQWVQLGGSPTVTLLNAAQATCAYNAPGTIAGTILTFRYTATDANGVSASDTVDHEILPVTERVVIGGVEVPVQTMVVADGSLQ